MIGNLAFDGLVSVRFTRTTSSMHDFQCPALGCHIQVRELTGMCRQVLKVPRWTLSGGLWTDGSLGDRSASSSFMSAHNLVLYIVLLYQDELTVSELPLASTTCIHLKAQPFVSNKPTSQTLCTMKG